MQGWAFFSVWKVRKKPLSLKLPLTSCKGVFWLGSHERHILIILLHDVIFGNLNLNQHVFKQKKEPKESSKETYNLEDERLVHLHPSTQLQGFALHWRAGWIGPESPGDGSVVCLRLVVVAGTSQVFWQGRKVPMSGRMISEMVDFFWVATFC